MTSPEMNPESFESIHEALLALQANPPVLAKTKDGQVGNQRTKYADLVQVNRHVLTRLNELGIIWTCSPTVLPPDFLRPVLAYKLLHVASDTSITGNYPLKGDTPQQQGSAITYARRYALLAVTGIAAEDDDDDGTGEGVRAGRRQAAPRARREAAPAERESATRTTATPAKVDSAALQRKMFAQFREMGLGGKEDRETRLALVTEMLDHPVSSVSDLNESEIVGVVDALSKAIKTPDPRAAAVEIYQTTTGAATGEEPTS